MGYEAGLFFLRLDSCSAVGDETNKGESEMKSTLLSLMTLGGALLATPHIYAATETVDGIEWTYTVSDGEASVSAAPDSVSGAMSIPSTLGGCPVTCIGNNAFRGCSSLTSVTIPDSVTSIAWGAFCGCSGLTSVTIPDSVTSIGDSAFRGCSGLSSVTIPDSVTSIGSDAFNGCSGLSSVTIPDSVTSIGDSTFFNCTNLTSVSIGNGVTNIEYSAFWGCQSLTSVIIPDSVTRIGDNAFEDCTGLTSATIPNSVREIGWRAFYGCERLQSVTLPGCLFEPGYDYRFPDEYFNGDSITSVCIAEGAAIDITWESEFWRKLIVSFYNLSTLAIPSTTTNVAWSFVAGSRSLRNVTIGEGNPAYMVAGDAVYSTDMKILYLSFSHEATFHVPDGVEIIGVGSFGGCTNLTSVTTPDSVTSMGDGAFWGCQSLTSLAIPDSVTSIGDSTFFNCTNLTSVSIGNGVTNIGENAFAYCSGLTSLTIPGSVTNIGSCAFDGCKSLADLYLPARFEGHTKNMGIPEGCTVHFVAAAPEDDIYVDAANGDDANDGLSWATAFKTLARAASAAQDGDMVLVAPGVYAEADAWFQPGVTLRSRDGAETTILDGEGVRQCVQFANGDSDAGFNVIGFSLRNGSDGGYDRPAAVYEGTRLENCVIEGCLARSYRGILYGCDLINCAIVGNRSEEQCVISSCRLWNCTVAGNNGGTWYYAIDEGCRLWNSIVWDNSNSFRAGISWGEDGQSPVAAACPAFTNCCVESLAVVSNYIANAGFEFDYAAQGCFEADPKFVDLANGDVRLRTGSPCLDAGAASWVVGTTDAAGSPRVQGAAVDLGAYEGAVEGFVISASAAGGGSVEPPSDLIQAGGSATFTAIAMPGRPFLGWTTNGVPASSAATLTLADIQSDIEAVATFGSATFYADAANGDDANDGLSWATAKASIQAAIDAAVDGESVIVGDGAYGSIDAYGKDIRIESANGAAATAIDGGGTMRCAYLGGNRGRGATLAGFTLRNGRAGDGGGAYGGTLLDCDIVGNIASIEGGGVCVVEAHRCRIVGNAISKSGSGWLAAYGGGAANSRLYSCLVVSNSISVAIGDSTTSVNILGGGVDIGDGACHQCTIADNRIEVTGDADGVDITMKGAGAIGSIDGCILYGNLAGGETSDYVGYEGQDADEMNLIGVDPLFADRVHGDYRLSENSPAIDKGWTFIDAWKGAPDGTLLDTDLDGNTRVQGNAIDLGCYESPYTVVEVYPDGNYRETVDGVEWMFTVENGEATIVNWEDSWLPAIPDDTEGYLAIPATLGGCPVTSIGWNAFFCCYNLTHVLIPEGVRTVESHAFCSCGLESVVLPESLETIEGYAFVDDVLGEVAIPAGVTSIGSGAFYFTSVTNFVVSAENNHYKSADGVIFSKDGSILHFYPCGREDASYRVPAGVATIDFDAFRGAWRIDALDVGDEVVDIRRGAFDECSSLRTLRIGANVSSVELGGVASFQFSAPSLEKIVVDEANETYCSIDGVLFSKDGTQLLYFPAAIGGEYAIPDGVTELGECAFEYRRSLTALTVPESVEVIGEGAFYDCESLADLYLPARFEGQTGGMGIPDGCMVHFVSPEPVTLELALPTESARENAGALRCVVRRTGPLAHDLVVTIVSSRPGDLSVPATVTIPAGSRAASFTATPVDNAAVDGTRTATISVAADSVEGAEATLAILDDEVPALALSPATATIREGEEAVFTVTRPTAVSGEALTVYLAGISSSQAAFPATVAIGAGETSATFIVAASDDETAEIDRDYTLRANATGYTAATAAVTIADDDVPGVTLTLAPQEVSEGAGPSAVYATLMRTSDSSIGDAITVTLKATPEGALMQLPSSVTIPAGKTGAAFRFGTIDNATVDGDRTVKIAGAIRIPSCGCDGRPSDGGAIAASLVIHDNDGPALTLSVEPATVREGLADAATLTLSHNIAGWNEDVAVALSHDGPAEIEIPETATIPAGERSVSVAVSTLDDGVTGGAKTVAIYADAIEGGEGGGGTSEVLAFAPGSAWLLVTDQNLPDFEVAEVSASGDAVSGGAMEFSFAVTNSGFKACDEAIAWAAYLTASCDSTGMAEETLLASGIIESGLGAGEAVAVAKGVTLPEEAGARRIGIRIDPEDAIAELDKSNNIGWSREMTVSPAYTAVASVEATTYLPGAEVRIAGQATMADGETPAAGVAVDVWVSLYGSVRTYSATTDAKGTFWFVFEPTAGEMGHFKLGAEYPGLGAHVEQDAFDILGIERVDRNAATCKLTVGQDAGRTIALRNLCESPLTGLSATVALPSGNFAVEAEMPETLEGGATVALNLSIEALSASPPGDWETATIRIESAEGCAFEFPLYLFAVGVKASLAAEQPKISANMVPGTPRYVEVVVANVGGADTGGADISFPAEYAGWMRVAGPAAIGNIPAGETASWTVELNATDGMPLNSPLSGSFAINADNADGILVPFAFTPVAEKTGRIRLRATDEYTAAGGSGVTNATVAVLNPYTAAIVETGTTGEDGWWLSGELPAGIYYVNVAADSHEGATQEVEVEPGATAEARCFISFNAVTFRYEVERVSVDDEYEINLVFEYAVQVPAPVLAITMPEELLPPEEGESLVFNVIVENKGLLAANDPVLRFSDIGYDFEPLVNYETIPASSLVIVPVRMTKSATPAEAFAKTAASSSVLRAATVPNLDNITGEQIDVLEKAMPCNFGALVEAWFICYEDPHGAVSKVWHSPWTRLTNTLCDFFSHINFPDLSGSSSGPGTPGGGNQRTRPGKNPPSDLGGFNCDQWLNLRERAYSIFIGTSFPIIKHVPTEAILDMTLEDVDTDERQARWLEWLAGKGLEFFGKVLWAKQKGSNNWKSALGYWLAGDWVPIEAKDFSLQMQGMLDDLRELYDAWDLVFGTPLEGRPKGTLADNLARHFSAIVDMTSEAWKTDTSKNGIERRQLRLIENEMEELRVLAALGAAFCSGEEVTAEDLALARATALAIRQDAFDLGYSSAYEACEASLAAIAADLGRNRSSMCASAVFELTQSAVMAREAFEGKLTIANGNSDAAMADIRFTPVVYGPDGSVCNDLFGIQQKEMTGLDGDNALEGGVSLAAGTEGQIVVRFVPTPDAAPSKPVTYSFGGTFRYVNEATGSAAEVVLLPIALSVNPCPRLALHYFMQRDVYGDNPLTADVVEPTEPAQLSLLVVNGGAGTAWNMRINSLEPEIVENEKGLAIDFRYAGAVVNGVSQAAAERVVLGDIAPGATAQARWNLECSLLGHIVGMDASFTQVNDWGNPETTLIESVDVHPLVRAVSLLGAANDDFLGIEGGDGIAPNKVWLSDGTSQSVSSGRASFVWNEGGDAVVTVVAEESGPFHTSVAAPAFAGLSVERAVRSDGTVLDARNVWTTRWRLPDGADPVEEPTLHIFDTVDSHGAYSYTVEFSASSGTVPSVVSFSGISEGALLASSPDSMEVTFSCPIEAASFAIDAISLTCQGERVDDLSALEISPVEGSGGTTFRLSGLAALQRQVGRYVLVVQAAKVRSVEGVAGIDGRSLSWGFIGTDAPANLSLADISVTPCGETVSGVINLSERNVTIAGRASEPGLAVKAVATQGESSEKSLGAAVVGDDRRFAIDATLPGGGAMHIRLDCSDAFGNVQSETIEVLLDVQPLFAEFSGAPSPDEVVDSVTLAFSAPVRPETVSAAILSLERDGVAVSLTGVTVGQVSDTHYTVSGLESVASTTGDYRLRADLSGVRKATSRKAGSGYASLFWRYVNPDREPPTVTSVLFDGEAPHGAYTNGMVFSSVSVTFSEPVNVPELIASGLIGRAARIDLLDRSSVATGSVVAVSSQTWNAESNTLSWRIDPSAVPAGRARLILDAGLIADLAGNPLSADGYAVANGLRAYALSDSPLAQVNAFAMPMWFDGELYVGEKTEDNKGKIRHYAANGAWSYLQSDGADIEVPAQGCQGASVAFADMDGDSDVETYVGTATGDVLRYPGGETIASLGVSRAMPFGYDLDGDGRDELVVGSMDGRIRVLSLDTNGTYGVTLLTDAGGSPLVVPNSRSAPVVADINNDGLADIVSGDTAGNVWAFLGDVATTPSYSSELVFASTPVAVFDNDGILADRSRLGYGDVNGDGIDDLIVGRSDGSVTVMSGAETPSPFVPFTVIGPPALAEALDATNLVWTTGGAAEWAAEWSAGASDGIHDARSGAIGDNTNSWIETAVDGFGTISFSWKVSCEERYDFAVVEIDGEICGRISGESGWEDASFALGSGIHTIRWTYRKGRSGTAGADAAWLDSVTWTPMPLPTLAEALEATNLVWTAGGDEPWEVLVSQMSSDGKACAVSGPIGDYGSSLLSTTVGGAGTLSFWWRVSCEDGYDWFDFYMDGKLQGSLTGESGWRQVSIRIAEGTHELLWEYWKDDMDEDGLTGDDMAFLDRVAFVPDEAVPPPDETPLDEPGYALPEFHEFLRENGYVGSGAGNAEINEAAAEKAANGVNTVWECYVAGISPTDETAAFRAVISWKDGQPEISWEPELSPEEAAKRAYRKFGRKLFTDPNEDWTEINGNEADFNFFKVSVEMK